MSDHVHHSLRLSFARHCIGVHVAFAILSIAPTFAAEISGRVRGAGVPIVGSTVTLWAESTGAPRQLARTRTDGDGHFILNADGGGAILYVTAKSGRPASEGADNPAITFLTVLGNKAPSTVTINEMTTIA